MRPDLAADLRGWLADKLTAAQDTGRQHGEVIPAHLPDSTPLFRVPVLLVRILDRDLVMAGIARKVKDENGKVRIDKRDDRGWTLDVHALRHTFGTLLSKDGVSLRTAQAAMRHSDPSLTATVYTDPRLLDVAGAMDALPLLPLESKPQDQQQKATGTYDTGPLAPTLAPTSYNSSKPGTSADKMADRKARGTGRGELAENPYNINAKRPLSFSDNSRLKSGQLAYL